MRRKPEPIFKTESELCAAFQAWAEKEGWSVYPETAGHDMLLVDKDGHQMAVEAKLKLNLKVISQILPSSWDWNHTSRSDVGPDYRAILIPDRPDFVCELMIYLGIEVFYLHNRWAYRADGVSFERYNAGAMHDWNPAKRFELPEYKSSHAAGQPAPIQLTPWKIGALRVVATLELDGKITRGQINAIGISPQRWCIAGGWLASLGKGKWARGDRMPAFEKQHPEVYAQILGEIKASRKPTKQVSSEDGHGQDQS